MIIVTSQEIAQFRSELAHNFSAMKALDEIENCEGNIEDAAISLALHAGQEPTTSEDWLESLAKRCRTILCEKEAKNKLLRGNLSQVVVSLSESNLCPEILAVPIILYIIKTGINDFCSALDD
jgi:hypothetical protein